MGAFAYCRECREGVAAPTAREDLIDGQFCSNGHRQDQRYSEKEWIAMLYENLQSFIGEGLS